MKISDLKIGLKIEFESQCSGKKYKGIVTEIKYQTISISMNDGSLSIVKSNIKNIKKV